MPLAAGRAEDGMPSAAVLAAMLFGVVIAFDSRAMVPLVWITCLVWFWARRPAAVAAWSMRAHRLADAVGGGWTLTWLSLLVGSQDDIGSMICGSVGWPFESFVAHVPSEPAIVSNFVWPLHRHPPRVPESDECLKNLLLYSFAAGAMVVRLRERGLLVTTRVLRWAVPAVPLAVLAVRKFSHDPW